MNWSASTWAWRGERIGFVELPARPEKLPSPWCAVCQRPVDRVMTASSGSVVRLIACCHGRLEIVDVPATEVRRGDRIELGVAFVACAERTWPRI